MVNTSSASVKTSKILFPALVLLMTACGSGSRSAYRAEVPLSITSHQNNDSVSQHVAISGTCLSAEGRISITGDELNLNSVPCNNGSFNATLELVPKNGTRAVVLTQGATTQRIDLNLSINEFSIDPSDPTLDTAETLTNGGFEGSVNNWDMSTTTYALDSDIRPGSSGSTSIRLSGGVSSFSQQVNVRNYTIYNGSLEPNATYELSFWGKVSGAGGALGCGYKIYNKAFTKTADVTAIANTTTWTRYTRSFALSEESIYVIPYCYRGSHATSAWLDDMSLKMTSPAPATSLNSSGVRSSLYPTNWSPGFAVSGQYLQDYSYAGYRRADEAVPSGAFKQIIDLTAAPYSIDKTGTTDASAAIAAAVADSASISGGAILYFPPGTYRISQPLVINQSGTVLRGAGPGRTFLRFDGAAVAAGARGISFTTASYPYPVTGPSLTADTGVFDTFVDVTNSSGFAVGDDIVIGFFMSDAYRTDYGVPTTDPDGSGTGWPSKGWGLVNNGGLLIGSSATITSVVGNRLNLDVPIRRVMKTRDTVHVRKVNSYISECGVEHLSLSNAVPTFSDAWAGDGESMISMTYAKNCWITNVASYAPADATPFEMKSHGVEIDKSKFITVDNAHMANPQNRKGGNGYGAMVGAAHNVLVQNSSALNCRHGFSSIGSAIGSAGLVFRKVKSSGGLGFESYSDYLLYMGGNNLKGYRAATDIHSGLAVGTLFDQSQFDDGLAAEDRGGMSGGASMTSERIVLWNLYGRGQIVLNSAGFGHLIGGSAMFTVHTAFANFTGKATSGSAVKEQRGVTIEPASLYLDQLARRHP